MHKISRRSFLKLAAAGVGGLALARSPLAAEARPALLTDFPAFERLGRIAVGMVNLKSRPDEASENVGVLYEDAVVPWLREVVGRKPYFINQRWVETPQGYIYAPNLQPVRNRPNVPEPQWMQTAFGQGMWAEVTVPYVQAFLNAAAPSSSSWVAGRLEYGLPPLLYYGQVFWVDQTRTNAQGMVEYRVNPNYYGGVDMLWADARAFRPILPQELEPLSPEVEDKRIVVDVTRQSLSCYEGNREVFYCRVSTGAKFDAYGNAVDKWATPLGRHRITRKYLTLQMSGGTTGASYDLPGIGWAIIFVTGGVAIHSTFWHNDFGVPRSHGCVNVLPEYAKWIFRWTTPYVTTTDGMLDVTLTGQSSTRIDVIES